MKYSNRLLVFVLSSAFIFMVGMPVHAMKEGIKLENTTCYTNDEDKNKIIDKNHPLQKEQLSSQVTSISVDGRDLNDFNDDDLNFIISECSNLEQLRLRRCDKVTAKGFVKASKNLSQKLKMLDLMCVPIDNEALLAIVKRCKSLERVKLNDCEKITAKGLHAVIPNLSENLKGLDLLFIKIDNAGFLTIAQRFQKLERLCLCGCEKITPKGFDDAIPQLSKNLRWLDLVEVAINGSNLKAVIDNCSNLESLFLSGCNQLIVDSFDPITLVHQLKKLKKLDLGNSTLDDFTLMFIAKNCPSIEELGFAGCKNLIIPDEEESRCKNLTTNEDWSWCRRKRFTTDGLWKAIVCLSKTLKKLDLGDLMIDDKTLIKIAQACYDMKGAPIGPIIYKIEGSPIIEDLGLAGCKYLTEYGLYESIGRLAKSLKRLDLSKVKINDDSLLDLARGCPKLEFFCIPQFNNLEKITSVLRQDLPCCKVEQRLE